MKKVIVAAIVLFISLSVFVGCFNGQVHEEAINSGGSVEEIHYKINTEKNSDKKMDKDVYLFKNKCKGVEYSDGIKDGSRGIKYIYEPKDFQVVLNKTLPDISQDLYEDNKICVENSTFEISEDLLNNINNVIDGYGGACSFYVVDMETNMTFGYNPTAVFPTASTVKAPFVLYAFKEIANGNGTLDETKVYESRFWREGSGIMQYEPTGGTYTIEQLIYNTINWSDNVAYSMVHDRFWSDRYNDMLEELGCSQYYLLNGAMWGYADAKSEALIWQEIYKYSQECEGGKIYFDMLLKALYSYIKPGVPQYESAHKSGWTESQCHDGGIIFGNRKYIITVLTDNSGNWSGAYQIQLLTSYANEVIDEYNEFLKDEKIHEKISRYTIENRYLIR